MLEEESDNGTARLNPRSTIENKTDVQSAERNSGTQRHTGSRLRGNNVVSFLNSKTPRTYLIQRDEDGESFSIQVFPHGDYVRLVHEYQENLLIAIDQKVVNHQVHFSTGCHKSLSPQIRMEILRRFLSVIEDVLQEPGGQISHESRDQVEALRWLLRAVEEGHYLKSLELKAPSPESQPSSQESQAGSPESQPNSPESEASSPESQASSPEPQASSPESLASSPESQPNSPEFQASSPESEAFERGNNVVSFLNSRTPRTYLIQRDEDGESFSIQVFPHGDYVRLVHEYQENLLIAIDQKVVNHQVHFSTGCHKSLSPQIRMEILRRFLSAIEDVLQEPGGQVSHESRDQVETLRWLLRAVEEGHYLKSLELKAPSPESQPSSQESQASSPESQPSSPESEASSPESQASSPEPQASSPESLASSPESQPNSPEFQASSPESEASSPESQALQNLKPALQNCRNFSQQSLQAISPKSQTRILQHWGSKFGAGCGFCCYVSHGFR